MKLIIVFLAIVGAYLSPMYFDGQLSMPMLLEAGTRSGLVVTICKWALKDFRELIYIIFLELSLIVCFAIIIIEWNYRFTGLDSVISEINSTMYWVEIGILTILGGRRIGTYIIDNVHHSNSDLRGSNRSGRC